MKTTAHRHMSLGAKDKMPYTRLRDMAAAFI
jgi:hypothetical protein